MLKIRLRRMGSRHRPFYRVVVSDSHRVPRSSALAEIGHYDPRQRPSVVKIDVERFDHWVAKGAKPSETVNRLVKKARAAADSAPAEPAVTESVEVPAEVVAAPAEAAEAAAEVAES